MNHPAQVVLAVSQIFWAKEISRYNISRIFVTQILKFDFRCLSSRDTQKALEDFKIAAEQQLSKSAELVRGDLTPLQRGTLMALITIDVHARGIQKTNDPLDSNMCKKL
jgi:hypothetical protein